ncbi:MAG TPA: energy transducer TonB, partial [Bryobacteraceae bacterium]|nr:energy transducer TonB [Bryobacteraceae bacterium]
VHLSLSHYTSPDPATCPDDPADAIVTFRVEDDGTTSEAGSAGPIGSVMAAAAVSAVKTWRFQPLAGEQPGTISGKVLLECRPARAGSATAGVYRVGSGVSAPSVLFKVDPEYSEKARQAKYQGTAVLSVVVDASGRAGDIRVIKPLGMGLDEEAVLAVKQWRFRPALKGGQPVDVRATIEINFKLL